MELESLRRLAAEYQRFSDKPGAAMDNYEIAACGAMLHSFYSGVENILKRIALTVDRGVPEGDASHKRLLNQMASASEQRGPLLSPPLYEDLKDYLNFRHVFRSAYSIDLRWDKMEPLVAGVGPVLSRFEAEVVRFLDGRSL